jgi:RNase H-fold protein (predicted Holliday junction resolvase)
MNILEEANNIVNKRSQEKEREYGPFAKSMEKTAAIATLMSDKNITVVDCYNVLIALKLSRESHSHKEDNLLDAVAYIGSLNNILNNEI